MKIIKEELAQELNQMLEKASQSVSRYQSMSIEQLNFKPSIKEWSILECIEHLNRYGRFYVPELQSQIGRSSFNADFVFKSGILGNYFAEAMRSKPKLNKMKTFRNMNPSGSRLDKEVLTELADQMIALGDIVDQFLSLNLTKIKTGITISSWIKLRLGDTLRVVIYHIDRHIDQANSIK